MIKETYTENGAVRGIAAADPRIISYKGVPFAAPPVGPLRWHAPVAAQSWEGVRDCYTFGPIAMQNIPGIDDNDIYTREWNVDPEIPMSEDCLYLNIWTPAKTKEERLPVYVWYYGGGLQVGNPAEMEFDGERIARRGIVVVTVNYRVNVFGFLAHPELTEEAPEAPCNFGHLDQQFGLRWVKRNIAAFGGDPDNITIGGQSAGGGSVLTQLNCPANRGYIQKAIIESGILTTTYSPHPTKSLEEVQKSGLAFFDALGVKTLKEARALPAEYIRDKCNAFGAFWGTCIDGVFQKDSYINSLYKGELLDVPLLLGHTDHEFFVQPPADTMDELVSYAENKFGSRSGEFLKIIHASDGIAEALENSKIIGMEISVQAAMRFLENCGSKSPHYYYEFGPEIPGWDDPGAFHSVDLWFFFETLAKCWRPFTGKHYDLARHMCNYWCNFIASGDPNGNDADGSAMEYWPAFDSASRSCMTFFNMPEMVNCHKNPLIELLIDTLADEISQGNK